MSRRTYPKEVNRKCWECGEQTTFRLGRFPSGCVMIYVCSKCYCFIDVHSFARREYEETYKRGWVGKLKYFDEDFDEDFLEKNMTCQHIYTKQDDDDYARCRRRNGLYEYEKYMKNMEKEIKEK